MSYPPTSPPADPFSTASRRAAGPPGRASRQSDRSSYYPESDATEHIQQYSGSRSSADMYAVPPGSPRANERDPMLNASRPAWDRERSSSFGDPYAYYAGESVSRDASSMNLSDYPHPDDGESQRNMYMRNSMGPRTVSNLYYEKAGEVKDVASNSGSSQRRRAGVPVSNGVRGRDAVASRKRGFWGKLSSRARKLVIAAIIIALLIIAVAVAVPVALKSSHDSSRTAQQTSNGEGIGGTTTTAPAAVPTGSSGADWKTAAYGGDKSIVYTEDGSSFVYNNSFGGYWVSIPFNDTARAQADVPRLNDTWDYNVNEIAGVNIGGWLLLEPFISPSLFEPFNTGPALNLDATVIDEWTLCEALGSNMSAVIEEHYATFITEKDFAQIAGAGLNWVRLPIPYWLIEVWDGEPFLANVGWTYFLKAITWARKYGLRINLDLHAVPGSQNGYNHSSKQGSINFLAGVMGVANAQRTLNYIRTLAEFVSQDQYKNVIPMFSILNEPYSPSIGVDLIRHFYLETYNMIRNDITGIGQGNGPMITFHDGFTLTIATNISAGGWEAFLNGADRIVLDTHPYLCFSQPNNDGLMYQATKPCAYWGAVFNETTATFGLTVAGEWSLAVNDCGKWINNVGNGQRYEGTYYLPGNKTAPLYSKALGNCSQWNDWAAYSSDTKAGLQQIAKSHMDTFRNWFFWTWKTGYSTTLGTIANPFWNYQLALENGFMPTDPRSAKGACDYIVANQGVTIASYPAPTLSPWMTGGAGAGTITVTSQLSAFSAWPPPTLGVTTRGVTPISNLPTYTPTGVVITMPVATPTSFPSGFSSSVNVGDGWAQPTDTAGWYTSASGCSYLNPWSGAGAAIPTTDMCSGGSRRKMRREPVPIAQPTAAPRPASF